MVGGLLVRLGLGVAIKTNVSFAGCAKPTLARPCPMWNKQ